MSYMFLRRLCVLFLVYCRARAGATAIEYALIAGGIALAIVVVVFALGDEVLALFQDVEAGLDGP